MNTTWDTLQRCKRHFELKHTNLNSKTPHPAKKDWGLCHLVHSIVTQNISLAAGQRRSKGWERWENKSWGIKQIQITIVINDGWHLHVNSILLLWAERPRQVIMYRRNKLACKESHQSPLSLQPCWSGDGEDPAIGETTAVPEGRGRQRGSQHG